VARHQTKGRGRFRRHWHADADSLTFSYLLFFDPEETELLAWLTQLVGLSVCLAIEDITDLEPQIRWPNDVLLDDRKVCGILCRQRKDAVVIGVGLNVNQTEFAEELNLPEAGSLRVASGRTWDKLELLEKIMEHLLSTLELARQGITDGLLEAVKKHSSVLHRRVEIKTLLRTHIGTVVSIDTKGNIVLRTTRDRIMVIGFGQIRRLR
jgi:BirA family biotin operon repressor/biotin-[acetyl-CoA-carboxylase] ligase